MDANQADLSVWTWEVLSLLSGSITRPDFGRPEDKAVPPLPSTIPSAAFSARDIPHLSFGLLECKAPPGIAPADDAPPLDEIPPPKATLEALKSRQHLVAADQLTLRAFRQAKRMSEEKGTIAESLVEAIARRRADLHRRGNEALYSSDLADYHERRASFNRSVAFFRDFIRDNPDAMDEGTIIAKQLEISHLEQRFAIEQRELETRFAHLWPIAKQGPKTYA